MQSSTSGSINPPDLSASLKPGIRSIKDAAQARNITKSLETAARERNLKNARIMSKYNSEKPYTQTELDNSGLGWKSNFTTKPLPMLIDKVAPRFVKVIEGAKYLTNSALPDEVPGAAKKTEYFRREVTATVRARPGWSNFISEIAQENALFGFTSVAWLDEFGWFPKHFRQDQFFVPTGTRQISKFAQVIELVETFLIHELFELISDKRAADAAGWDVKAVVAVLNSAMPENRRCKESNWERVYEDLQRESNVGLSHESGALTVTVKHLLAAEITGKVSHYILTEKESSDKDFSGVSQGEILFEREDQFESMSDAAAFFSFQIGNGKLHGSKGIGREIYNMVAMLDRNRNEVVDRLQLAGKLIIQCDPKGLRRFKMSVVGNALLIDQGFNISERKIDPAVEPFLELDSFLTGLLDQMVGATTPKVFEGERVTKAQVDLFAAREEESRDNIIGRFLTQFADMMSAMQRRLCNPNTSDADAKQLQERLKLQLTSEEIKQLAEKPVAETVKDFTEIERQQIVLIATEARGNALYNQREIERRKLSAIVDEEFADAVLLPEEDSTVVAEQTRLQQFELMLLVNQATEVPVSPRDNHLVHLQVLAPAMDSAAAETVKKGAEGLEVLHALVKHAEQHFAAAQQAGVPKEKLGEVEQFLQKARVAMQQIEQLEASQPPPGAPVAAAPPPPPV